MQPNVQAEIGLSGTRLERVLEFVEKNLERKLTIDDLAGVAHLSPFHFARVFKRATGRTPHAYLTHRRVERAKRMLREGSLPLVQVATCVGFQTQGHFTWVFRRYAGTTPHRYRHSAAEQTAPAIVETTRLPL